MYLNLKKKQQKRISSLLVSSEENGDKDVLQICEY